MKLNQFLGIFCIAALLAVVSPAGAAVFQNYDGTMAPGNWSAMNIGASPGAYSFSSGYRTLVLSASPNGNSSDIAVSDTVVGSFTMNLSWNLIANGSSGALLGYYVVDGGTPTAFSVSSGTVTVSGSSSLTFELSSIGTMSGKVPGELDISFTDFKPVPEPAAWPVLGGSLLAGIYLVFAVVRQLRLRRRTT